MIIIKDGKTFAPMIDHFAINSGSEIHVWWLKQDIAQTTPLQDDLPIEIPDWITDHQNNISGSTTMNKSMHKSCLN